MLSAKMKKKKSAIFSLLQLGSTHAKNKNQKEKKEPTVNTL